MQGVQYHLPHQSVPCHSAHTSHPMPTVRRLTTARALNSTQGSTYVATPAVDALLSWISAHGGFVHPALRMADPAPCGARGIIAQSPVTSLQLEQASLVTVPHALYWDNRLASQQLISWLTGNEPLAPGAATASAAKLPPTRSASSGTLTHEAAEQLVTQLTATQQLALAVSVERQRGADSPWHIYLETVPFLPPTPWFQPADQTPHVVADVLASRIDAGSHDSSSDRLQEQWVSAVAAQRAERMAYCQEAVDVLSGHALRLDIDDVAWSMAQIDSRSLGSGSASGLLPFIDLLNHDGNCRPPMLQLNDDDKLVMTVTSIRGTELAPLAAGDELCINYFGGGCPSPLQMFLKFGFVARDAIS